MIQCAQKWTERMENPNVNAQYYVLFSTSVYQLVCCLNSHRACTIVFPQASVLFLLKCYVGRNALEL